MGREKKDRCKTIAEYIEAIKKIKDKDSCSQFNKVHDDAEFSNLIKNSTGEQLFPLIEDCIKCQTRATCEMAEKIFEKRKLIDWKDDKNSDKIIKLLVEHATDHAEDFQYELSLFSVSEKFFESLKTANKIKKYENELWKIIIMCMNIDRGVLQGHRLSQRCSQHIEWSKHYEWIKEFLEKLLETIMKEPEITQNRERKQFFYHYVEMVFCFMFINLRKPTSGDISILGSVIKDILEFCKDQEWQDEDDSDRNTIHYLILTNILGDILSNEKHANNVELMKPCLPALKELWDHPDGNVGKAALSVAVQIKNTEILGENIDALLQKYFNGEDDYIISSISNMCQKEPHKFIKYTDTLFEKLCADAGNYGSTIIQILQHLFKHSPKLVTDEHVKHFVWITFNTEYERYMSAMALADIARLRTELIPKHDAEFQKMMMSDDMTLYTYSVIIMGHAMRFSKKLAKTYIIWVIEAAEKRSKDQVEINAANEIRTMAAAEKDIVEPHRHKIEKLLGKTNGYAAESYRNTLDILDGKTISNIADNLEEQKEAIDDLDERVATNEENTKNLSREVDGTKKDVKIISNDVNEAKERIDKVEENIDEVEDKVKELDHKTLSHAPAWSREVSKLMNVESEHDWRLLAIRLGYSQDDVRNWATQPDPCLSMLDEWFATHKTREATFAVHKNLEEIGRKDAAKFVKAALDESHDVVEDDDDDEPFEPPPIFISYQWDHQNEMKMLKKHLSMAGFDSWMDIGQMGGGDKLFAKIDQGIRASKIVVCCVTEKYARSANCNREVNLAVTLGKPIIPLLVEKMQWPPPGAMGPIFGEYLFIRFFARAGEECPGVFWPKSKFMELLMQARFFMAPNEDMITKEYKNWWITEEEEIVLKERKEQKSDIKTGNTDHGEAESRSPEVFISYQWGKQDEIKKLFRKLNELGIRSWLDIMQMGGGDSLYDKIDRGIRGAEVIISCVTGKYAKSANCRREVSLADALKKTIVPILLDDSAWPPEGPMSVVMSPLLYINFNKVNEGSENIWSGQKFEELLTKIKKHLPNVHIQERQRTPIRKETIKDGKSKSKESNNRKSSVSCSLS